MRSTLKFIFIFSSLVSMNLFAGPGDMTPAPETVCQMPTKDDSIADKRAKYVCEIETYLPLVHESLVKADTTEQEQAQVLNNLRRTIGKKYKDLTPHWLKQIVYCRNQVKYKDALGPDYQSLAKSKTDAEIVKSAMRTGGQNLLLDRPTAVAIVDHLNYLGYGSWLYALWSWLPGESCAVIE